MRSVRRTAVVFAGKWNIELETQDWPGCGRLVLKHCLQAPRCEDCEACHTEVVFKRLQRRPVLSS